MTDNPQAAAFLRCLGGDRFIFQTFTDSKEKRSPLKEAKLGKKFDPLARVLIGTYEEHKLTLDFLSSKGAGIFVQVNAGEKRGKSSVTKIRSLFVDLDNPATTKKSIETIKQYMPRPSILTQSSPGKFHIYWKVTDCHLDQFTPMQQQLAIKFDTDASMKNLDRVMRLPGYKHQKKDTFNVTATIFGTEYSLDALYQAASKAPTLTTTATSALTQAHKQESGIKKDVFGLNLGSDYEVPNKLIYGETSRTQGLFAYGCHIMGKNEGIESILKKVREFNSAKCEPPLTDDELELEVFPGLLRYTEERDIENEQKAKKAIANHNPIPIPEPPVKGVVPQPPAEPVAVADLLLDRYIFSVEGQRVIDTEASGEYQICTLPEFKALMKNAGTKKYDLSSQWMSDPDRKTCRDVMWYPTDSEFIKEGMYRFYNLYRKPLITPVTKEKFDIAKLDIFFEHMNWLFPVAKDREFFLNWFAKTVTSPTVRIPWAPLLISDEGAGKGFIFKVLSELLGVENADNITMQSLESQFNPYLMKCAVLLIDEVSKPKQPGINDKLKAYISETRLKINRKGMQERTFPIYCNAILFSNNDDAALMQDGDRRYWVHRIDGVRDSTYYDRIFGWFIIETKTTKNVYTDNLEHLLRWCLDRDLSKFAHNHKPPLTASKTEMIYASRTSLEVDLRDAIDNKEGPFGADIVAVPVIKEYLSMKRDDIIKVSEERMIARILSKIAPSQLVKNAITAVDSNITGRFRVRCVRNAEYWAAQDLIAHRREFTRSMQIHMNHKDVLPPVQITTKGDSNEEPCKS